MPVTRSMRKKLEYLVRTTGRAESEIVAQALEDGLDELYRRQIADAYLTGRLSRDKAGAELGGDAIESLDYARDAIDEDVGVGTRQGHERYRRVPVAGWVVLRFWT
jgi:hypothetical protein